MITTKELIDEAISLPLENKAKIVDSILKSMNSTNETIQDKWIKLAKKRLKEIQSGKIKAIPIEEVTQKLINRLSK